MKAIDLLRRPPAWLALAALLPLVLGDFHVELVNYVYIHALVTLGLVLLTGVTGLVSFGQAAFVGIGAYGTGYLTVVQGMSPWLGLPLVLASTAATAWVIGRITLGMSGHYLALATLAWGISIYYLFGNIPDLGGYNGLSGVPPLELAGISLRGPRAMYYMILLILAGGLWSARNLLDSRSGRVIRSLRRGSLLGESFGADTARLKIAVFVLAAVLAGLSGWLYAHFQRFLNPTPFGLQMGVEYLFMAVIGGAGSVWGALVGTAAVSFLKQWLQGLLPELIGQRGNFEIIVFGALMLLILQRANDGLWPYLVMLTGRQRRPPAVDPKPLGRRRDLPGAGTPVLSIGGLRKTFGGLVAVNDVGFGLAAGEILGLIGPNGAGKSTVFNLITGVLPPSAGEIRFCGRRIDHLPGRVIAAAGIARTFQHVQLVPTMSLRDNVALGAYQRGASGVVAALLRLNRGEERRLAADAAAQLERVGLLDLADELAANLPLGQQRILEIARALAADPVLLLLDEPAAGLRYGEKQQLAELLLALRAEGLAILLVEHDMEFVGRVADRLVVMNFGEKLSEGLLHEVQADHRVQVAYLGADA